MLFYINSSKNCNTYHVNNLFYMTINSALSSILFRKNTEKH
ncbi:hypothetical protein NEISICOT_00444 [Neisseria sicca ATCC 29256]|uniref:Uncharacterized protein n=1 Tax=Neisseria sicca ATCC 29256 TaxID=547045 RepID=C6M1Q8_NEISI|nr:hypothetical protein NEISICOT_00444 [Neisseria sicca ATCC 29256]